jgi:L-threonate 2-dehydrogenase
MPLGTVAVVGIGEMGSAVGTLLHAHGLDVITNLNGRGPRSTALAKAAGMRDVGDDQALVREADMVLSILPPSHAVSFAGIIARALHASAAKTLFVDCNAVSPETTRQAESIIIEAGSSFIDAGILGPPPRPDSAKTIFYASGEQAERLAALNDFGLRVKPIGPVIGHASAFKMCYAGITKGLWALATENLVACRALGIEEPFMAEFQESQSALLGMFSKNIPGIPPKALRWIPEMEEIAATFQSVGLTPRMLEGAADMYRLMQSSPLGAETPDNRTRGTDLPDVVKVMAEALKKA